MMFKKCLALNLSLVLVSGLMAEGFENKEVSNEVSNNYQTQDGKIKKQSFFKAHPLVIAAGAGVAGVVAGYAFKAILESDNVKKADQVAKIKATLYAEAKKALVEQKVVELKKKEEFVKEYETAEKVAEKEAKEKAIAAVDAKVKAEAEKISAEEVATKADAMLSDENFNKEINIALKDLLISEKVAKARELAEKEHAKALKKAKADAEAKAKAAIKAEKEATKEIKAEEKTEKKADATETKTEVKEEAKTETKTEEATKTETEVK